MEDLIFIARTVHLGNDSSQVIQGIIGFAMIALAWFIAMNLRAKKLERGEEVKGSGCGLMVLIWIPLAIISGIIAQGLF
jgi:hypothetical protein